MDRLPSVCRPLGQSSAPHKLRMVPHTCNPNIQEVEAGGSKSVPSFLGISGPTWAIGNPTF